MAAYNTVPTEDVHLNEPKAPQNRMLALVAAVCFASAVAGATVAPSAVRGLSRSPLRRRQQYLLPEEEGTRHVHPYRNQGDMWNDRGHYGQHVLLK